MLFSPGTHLVLVSESKAEEASDCTWGWKCTDRNRPVNFSLSVSPPPDTVIIHVPPALPGAGAGSVATQQPGAKAEQVNW